MAPDPELRVAWRLVAALGHQVEELISAIDHVDAPGIRRVRVEDLAVVVLDEDGEIFHTYSAYARGIDMVNGTYQFLDLVPKGRDEPPGDPQFWVRRHDEYGT